jgi:hypothetical protein
MLVRDNNYQLTDEFRSLAKTLVNSFFDNIIDDEVWEQDLMKFLAHMFEVS